MQHTIQTKCTVECNDCDFLDNGGCRPGNGCHIKVQLRHICKSYADLKSGEKNEKMFTQKR